MIIKNRPCVFEFQLFFWIVAFFAILNACGALEDEDKGQVSESKIPTERRGIIPTKMGFVDGKLVEFYDFGEFVPTDANWFPTYEKFPGMPVNIMYVWTDKNGDPSLNSQFPIVDTLPKQAYYSDFFYIVLVVPPNNYVPNSIKSRGSLLLADFELKHTGVVLNCPVVGQSASLEDTRGKTFNNYRKLQLWYRNTTTYCMAMEGGIVLFPQDGAPFAKTFSSPVATGQNEVRVAAGKIFTLTSSAYSGADRVTGIPVPQNDIFRYAPGSVEYSPLVQIWDVTVPSDYVNGQLSSYADLFPIPEFTDPRIQERSPAAFRNCSIVRVAE
ncbi:MAG: hypothetical protein V1754_14250 [Pseudomonadota bacterium]